MSDRKTLLSSNGVFSQPAVPAASAPTVPAPSTGAQDSASPRPPKPAEEPKTQVKFYALRRSYKTFQRAHALLRARTGEPSSLSEHLTKLMDQESERIRRDFNDGQPFEV